MSKPREFWVRVRHEHVLAFAYSSLEDAKECSSNQVSEPIHVREVLPGHNDSERLDWMIENNVAITQGINGYFDSNR